MVLPYDLLCPLEHHQVSVDRSLMSNYELVLTLEILLLFSKEAWFRL
jgi:hypothetical protein